MGGAVVDGLGDGLVGASTGAPGVPALLPGSSPRSLPVFVPRRLCFLLAVLASVAGLFGTLSSGTLFSGVLGVVLCVLALALFSLPLTAAAVLEGPVLSVRSFFSFRRVDLSSLTSVSLSRRQGHVVLHAWGPSSQVALVVALARGEECSSLAAEDLRLLASSLEGSPSASSVAASLLDQALFLESGGCASASPLLVWANRAVPAEPAESPLLLRRA